jgi:hypothetical protein
MRRAEYHLREPITVGNSGAKDGRVRFVDGPCRSAGNPCRRAIIPDTEDFLQANGRGAAASVPKREGGPAGYLPRLGP